MTTEGRTNTETTFTLSSPTPLSPPPKSNTGLPDDKEIGLDDIPKLEPGDIDIDIDLGAIPDLDPISDLEDIPPCAPLVTAQQEQRKIAENIKKEKDVIPGLEDIYSDEATPVLLFTYQQQRRKLGRDIKGETILKTIEILKEIFQGESVSKRLKGNDLRASNVVRNLLVACGLAKSKTEEITKTVLINRMENLINTLTTPQAIQRNTCSYQPSSQKLLLAVLVSFAKNFPKNLDIIKDYKKQYLYAAEDERRHYFAATTCTTHPAILFPLNSPASKATISKVVKLISENQRNSGSIEDLTIKVSNLLGKKPLLPASPSHETPISGISTNPPPLEDMKEITPLIFPLEVREAPVGSLPKPNVRKEAPSSPSQVYKSATNNEEDTHDTKLVTKKKKKDASLIVKSYIGRRPQTSLNKDGTLLPPTSANIIERLYDRSCHPIHRLSEEQAQRDLPLSSSSTDKKPHPLFKREDRVEVEAHRPEVGDYYKQAPLKPFVMPPITDEADLCNKAHNRLLELRGISIMLAPAINKLCTVTDGFENWGNLKKGIQTLINNSKSKTSFFISDYATKHALCESLSEIIETCDKAYKTLPKPPQVTMNLEIL